MKNLQSSKDWTIHFPHGWRRCLCLFTVETVFDRLIIDWIGRAWGTKFRKQTKQRICRSALYASKSIEVRLIIGTILNSWILYLVRIILFFKLSLGESIIEYVFRVKVCLELANCSFSTLACILINLFSRSTAHTSIALVVPKVFFWTTLTILCVIAKVRFIVWA